MKSTGISRPVDALGRIVIPKEVRTAFGIRAGDKLTLTVEGDALVYRRESTDEKRAFDALRDIIAKRPDIPEDSASRLRELLDGIEKELCK